MGSSNSNHTPIAFVQRRAPQLASAIKLTIHLPSLQLINHQIQKPVSKSGRLRPLTGMVVSPGENPLKEIPRIAHSPIPPTPHCPANRIPLLIHIPQTQQGHSSCKRFRYRVPRLRLFFATRSRFSGLLSSSSNGRHFYWVW